MTRLMINLKMDETAGSAGHSSTDIRGPVLFHETLDDGSQLYKTRQSDIEAVQHGSSSVYAVLWYANETAIVSRKACPSCVQDVKRR